MGDAYRGLTIRIGADTSSLERSMKGLDKTARQLQSSFRAASRAFKVDGDVALQRQQMRLLGQQAETSSARLARLSQAERQASAQSRALATSTRNAALQEARFASALTGTEATLESFYESWARATSGMSKGKAFDTQLAKIKEITHAYNVGAASYQKFASAVRSGVMKSGFDDPFDLGSGVRGANEYVAAMKRLNAEWHRLSKGKGDMGGAADVQRTRNQIELLKSEIRSATDEEVRFESSLQRLGTGGFRTAAADVERLGSAIKGAEADASRFDKLLRLDPKNVDVARAKFSALRGELALIEKNKKALETRTKMAGSGEIEDIERKFGSTANAVATVGDRLTEARAKLRGIDGELDEIRSNIQAMRAVGDLPGIERARAEMKGLERASKAARVEVRNLERDNASVNRAHAAREAGIELEYMKGKAEQAGNALTGVVAGGRRLGQIGASIKTLGYSLSATIGSGAMMAGMYAIQAAKDFDSAYRDMRKTVNGTEEEFEHLRQAALDFSTTHFTSADQIMSIEAIGGQLGIQAQNLEKFGEVVSNLDIATNVDTETMAQNLGQLANIMNDMDQDLQSGPGSFEAYSDALVRLGNNSAAQEDKIQNVMMRIASMGTISDMSTPDLLALSTAVAATGQGAEAAGTAVSKTFSNIEGAVNGSDAALEKIRNSSGLTEDEIEELTQSVEDGQATLRDFAEVAGMSSEEFKGAWNTDPTSAFKAFIGGLKRIDAEGGSVDSTLKSLGINSVRQKQTLNGLVQTFDVLNDSLLMSNNAWNGIGDVWGDAGDAAREAQRKAEGFSGQWQQMVNSAQYLGVELTDSLTPAIAFAADALGGLAAGFNGLPDTVKLAVSGIGLLTAATGPMSIFFGGVMDGMSTINTALYGNSKAWAKVVREQKRGGDALLAACTASSAASGKLDALGGKVFDVGQKMKKANGQASKLGNGISKLGLGISSLTTGKMIGIGAAIAGVSVVAGLAIDAYSKWVEHCKMVEQAHQTMSERISDAMGSAAASVEEGVASSEEALAGYQEHLEKCAESNEQLAKAAKDAFSKDKTIEQYANKISPLLSKLNKEGDLTESEFAELQTAINGYNQVTGDSITVTRGEDGAIRVLKDGVDVTAAAFDNLADAKRRAAKASHLDTEYQTLIQQVSDGQEKLAALQDADPFAIEKYTEFKRQYDELMADPNTTPELRESLREQLAALEEAALPQLNLLRELSEAYLQLAQTEQMTTLLKKDSKDMSPFEKLVAGSDKLQLAFSKSKVGVLDFESAISVLGEDMGKVFADKDGLIEWLGTWDGTTKGLIDHLSGPGGLGIALSDVQKRALILNGTKIGDKTFSVTDKGTIMLGEQKIEDLDNIKVGDKTYSLKIDTENATATLESTEGEVIELGKTVTDTSESSELKVKATTNEARTEIDKLISDYTGKPITVEVRVNKKLPTIADMVSQWTNSATGGMLPSARMIRHAKGGYFVDRPTVIGRTGNVTHIAGEAGREFVSMNAKGGVVLPLTNPYMRPWVRAVADQMGGSVSTNVNITLAYGADANAKQMVYDIGREMRLQGLMRG